MQQVKAGIQAIYLSGWQVAADNNEYSAMFPDQSLYPVDSVPKVVSASTMPSPAPTKFQHSKALKKATKVTPTTSLRSLPMQKPVSAAF